MSMSPEPGRHRRAEPELRSGSESIKRTLDRYDPFWGAQLVVAAALLLDLSLPKKLTLVQPTWLLPAVEGLLLVGLLLAAPSPELKRSPLRRNGAMALIGLVSLVNIISLGLLVHFLLQGRPSDGHSLVVAGAVLWLTNVLLFGLWYWQLDRGGPLERAQRSGQRPDFLFPQMTETKWSPPDWMPGLVDYLYVSFTNAAAFSPTDTMPLSQMAKLLMTAQALTALVTVGLVVARAVNILQG